jgi:hypothetical protein
MPMVTEGGRPIPELSHATIPARSGLNRGVAMNDSLANIRPAPWWLFVLMVAALLLVNLFSSWVVPVTLWKPLFERTYGLVHVGYIVILLFWVGVVLLGIGRRRPAEVGIEPRKVPAGLVYMGLVWLALQVVMLGWYWLFDKPIEIANGWDNVAVLDKFGRFVSHLLGNALYEEIVFRGFFLMQFVLLFHTRWPDRPRLAFVLALVLMAVLFSMMHVPDRLGRQQYTSWAAVVEDQIELIVNACVFGWIYWWTRNLFFAVGLHGLVNLPTTLFAWHAIGPLAMPVPIVLALGVVISWVWVYLFAKAGDRARQCAPSG